MRQPNNVTFFAESREEGAKANKRRGRGSRGTFFLEQVATDECLKALRSIRGRVAIALNATEVRTDGALIEFLQTLNKAETPVDAWVTLAERDYWVHAGNVVETWRQIYDVVNALDRAHVDIANVGLDLEFPSRFMVPGISLREYWATKAWTFDRAKAHDTLVSEAHRFLSGSKRGLHTYEIPVMSDSSLIRWALGMVAAPTTAEIDDERYKRIALTYTSGAPLLPAKSFISHYAHGKDRIPALGIVTATDHNPGRNMSYEKMLGERGLERDVRIAMERADEFFVFALNGQGVVDRTQAAIRQALLPVQG